MHARPSITSTSNARLKELRRLAARPSRARGSVLVEGWRLLAGALDGDARVESVYVAPELWLGRGEDRLVESAAARGASVTVVGAAAFAAVSSQSRPDGMLAVVARPSTSLQELRLDPSPLVVVCEAIERPGNLGTIVRAASAAGASALVACDPQTDLFQPRTVSASVGAVFRLPLATATVAETVAWLRAGDLAVVVATPHGPVAPWVADLARPTAVVLGSEKRGVSRPWLDAADVQLGIPMPGGGADSLNVAVAAGVVLFEAARQRLAVATM
jgi:TrmH family RNA methyltransferase